MLNVMRDNLKHLKPVLWVVAISMVAYLGAYFSCGDKSGGVDASWVAKIDDSTIDVRDFREQARRMDEYYRKLLGQQYEQLKGQIRLGSSTLSQMIDQRVMLLEAKKLGLEASPEEISRVIHESPSFQDANGKFVGRERYLQLIARAYRGGAPAYERSLADQIVVQKWQMLVSESTTVSDREVEDLYRLRNEKTAMRYVLVPSADVKTSTAVSDDELRAWYDAHLDDYLKPEARKIRYVVVERQKLADGVQVTDDEIKKYYDDNAASFEHPEQRRASHILFRVEQNDPEGKNDALVEEHAETVRRQLENGGDFAATARADSQDPGSAARGGDLGWFGKGQMVPAFEKAVWATPVGQIAPVTRTEFGYHIIKVTGERPAGKTPLQDVAGDIRAQLRVRKAQERMQAEADRIRGEIASPADLDAVAAKEGLTVKEATVAKGDRLAELAPSPEFRDTVFGMEPDTVSSPLGVARGLAIVACEAVVPPSTAPLDEVRERVATAILNQRARDAALARARQAETSGKALDAVARSLGVKAEDSGDLAPGPVSLPGAGGPSPELRARLFADDAKVGDRGVVVVPAGAVVYEITKRTPFDAKAFEAARPKLLAELQNQKSEALLQSLLPRLRERYDVRINSEIVKQFDS